MVTVEWYHNFYRYQIIAKEKNGKLTIVKIQLQDIFKTNLKKRNVQEDVQEETNTSLQQCKIRV